jgi:hypothetical protein
VAVNATNAFNLLVGQQFFSLSACYDRMCILVTISQGSRVLGLAALVVTSPFAEYFETSVQPHTYPLWRFTTMTTSALDV